MRNLVAREDYLKFKSSVSVNKISLRHCRARPTLTLLELYIPQCLRHLQPVLLLKPPQTPGLQHSNCGPHAVGSRWVTDPETRNEVRSEQKFLYNFDQVILCLLNLRIKSGAFILYFFHLLVIMIY